MRLGGQIEDAVDVELGQQAGGELLIGDISFHEREPGIVVRANEIAAVASIGELVQDHETLEALDQQQLACHGRTDKAGAAGEEDRAKFAHAAE